MLKVLQQVSIDLGLKIQKENIFLEKKILKNHIKIQELKNITVIKNSLDEFHSRFEMVEERTNDLEDKSIGIIQCKETRKINRGSEIFGTLSSIPTYI